MKANITRNSTTPERVTHIEKWTQNSKIPEHVPHEENYNKEFHNTGARSTYGK